MTAVAPALDGRKHVAATLAALTASIGPDPITAGARAFTFDKVPGEYGVAGQMPNIYAAVTVDRRPVSPQRAGTAGRSGWRISVRFVGRDIDEALWCAWAVAKALDNARLTVDGYETTPVAHESTLPPERDDQRWSGLSTWTYGI